MVMKLKKSYLLVLSLIIIVLSMSCVSAGLFDGLFGGEDDAKNITLIKEKTHGRCTYYDSGKVHAIYSIEGVLKDLPENIDGYDLQFLVYNDNGKLLKESSATSMKYIAENSKKSEPVELGALSLDKFENVSIVKLKLINEDGTVVFDKNVTFNMENVDIEYYHENDPEKIEERKEAEKERYLDSKEFNDKYWNTI